MEALDFPLRQRVSTWDGSLAPDVLLLGGPIAEPRPVAAPWQFGVYCFHQAELAAHGIAENAQKVSRPEPLRIEVGESP
ncbi:MAG TPA: hypothetical protein DCQ20_06165, partial [Nitrospira sp.]|nr:hypothetical protein [Nitrospira sp.]